MIWGFFPIDIACLLCHTECNCLACHNWAGYVWLFFDRRDVSLDDASDRNPSFTPDAEGKYTLTEASSGATLDVYAGTWMGIITGGKMGSP